LTSAVLAEQRASSEPSRYGAAEMSDEEYASFYDFEAERDREYISDDYFTDNWSDEDVTAFATHEADQEKAEEEYAAEQKKEQIVATVKNLVPSVPPEITGSKQWKLILILLAVFFVFVISLLVYKTKHHEKPKSAPTVQVSEQALQQEIDSLARQGYDYRRINEVLVGKGYPAYIVEAEIRKHYSQSARGQGR
jgi:hypothetical protein